MSTTEEIKSAIGKLPSKDRKRIVSWMVSADEKEWDQEIESDVSSGFLNDLAREALEEHRDDKTQEL